MQTKFAKNTKSAHKNKVTGANGVGNLMNRMTMRVPPPYPTAIPRLTMPAAADPTGWWRSLPGATSTGYPYVSLHNYPSIIASHIAAAQRTQPASLL